MALPSRFLSLLTKNGLPELLAPTYAKAKLLDLNEAYLRLEDAARQVVFVQHVQDSVWRGLQAERPDSPVEEILGRVEKRLKRRKKYQVLKYGRKEDIAMTAWALHVDLMAGRASGEAADLIASPEGSRLLQQGIDAVGRHLAKELLR